MNRRTRTIKTADAAKTGQVRIPKSRRVSELKPTPENFQPLGLYKPILPDDPETLDLVASIRTHGFNSTLVISEDGYILSGHRRAVAAPLAGVFEVPCIVEPVSRYIQKRRGNVIGDIKVNPAFLAKLEAYNRQRTKTLDEQLREAVVRADPTDAHRALTEYRQSKASDFDAETIEIRGYKHRARISKAKLPFVSAVKNVINRLRAEWPVTDREVHYELLNDPPLRHASKPDSVYNNTSKECLNRATCTREHNAKGKHVNSGPDCFKDLSDLLTRMRLAGLIPWSCLDDTTRPVTITKCWQHAAVFLNEQTDRLLKGYYRDLMQSQTDHIEIMYEKDAGHSTVAAVAVEHCIPLTVGRGFSSIPPRYAIAQRYKRSGKDRLIILAMSDLDPDGDEIAHSFARSLRDDFNISNVELIKVALTMDQARERHLAESAFDRAKPSSPNYQKYIKRYGTNAIWELSALPRAEQKRLLIEAIESVIDVNAYNHEVQQEKQEAAYLDEKRQRALIALGDLETLST